MLPQQALDLRADLCLGGFAVGPINGEVAADVLDELVRDCGEQGVGLHVLSATGQSVIKRSLFLCEAQLLVAMAGIAELLGDLNEARDDLRARELSQVVAL